MDIGIPGFDLPSWEDMVNGIFNALAKVFGIDASESIEKAMTLLLDIPPVDFSSDTFGNVYGGMFAIGLILGGIGMLLRIVRASYLKDMGGMGRAVLELPIIYIIGFLTPAFAYLLQGAIGELNSGLVGFFTGKDGTDPASITVVQLPSLDGVLGFVVGVLAYMAAFVLQLQAYVIVNLLPFALALGILALGARWLGFLGNALFTLSIGIALTALLAVTFQLLVLGILQWASNVIGKTGSDFGAAVVALFAIYLVAWIPVAMVVLYFKRIAQHVNGIMETRVLGAPSATAGSTSSSGGLASKVALAGGSALIGSVIAMQNNPRDSGTSRSDHVRDMAGSALQGKAMMAMSSHPVTAAAMLAGSKLIKPRPKPDPIDPSS